MSEERWLTPEGIELRVDYLAEDFGIRLILVKENEINVIRFGDVVE
ncbi:MAG: hypothetical protein ACE5GD_05395 [Candidatus Geothermarchaeales archaeon]